MVVGGGGGCCCWCGLWLLVGAVVVGGATWSEMKESGPHELSEIGGEGWVVCSFELTQLALK